LAKATGIRSFGYSGGVASNIKVNRLIRSCPDIDRLAVCPAMGDGGLALGAAQAIWLRLTASRPSAFSDFRLGTDFGDLGRDADSLAAALGVTCTRPTDIAVAVADRVAAGEIVMWAQGRMELGARALGARGMISISDSNAAFGSSHSAQVFCFRKRLPYSRTIVASRMPTGT
jgi:carbamoyltransferase